MNPFALAIIALIAMSCAEDYGTGIVEPSRASLLGAVTPEVAASIGPDGKFVLPQASGVPGEISAPRARELARVWGKVFAPLTQSWLEEGHGAPVDVNNLEPCGRTFYAVTPFEELPSDIPSAIRRRWGSWWLVTLCSGLDPQVSLAVSAGANELRIENGQLIFPFVSGNEFFPVGIPAAVGEEYPISPEHAVVSAARTLGRRISTLPELRMTVHTDGPPQGSRWRFTLDQPTTVTTDSGAVPTGELFVGKSKYVFETTTPTWIAARSQPESIDFFVRPDPKPGEKGDSYEARVKAETVLRTVYRKKNSPIAFDRVTLQ